MSFRAGPIDGTAATGRRAAPGRGRRWVRPAPAGPGRPPARTPATRVSVDRRKGCRTAPFGGHRVRPRTPPRRRIAGVHAVQRAEVAHVVDDAQVVVDGRILRHVADAPAQGSGAGRLAEDRDAARGEDLGSDDAAHQRGLAAARRAEQAGDGAAGDLDRQVVDRGALAADNPQMVDDDDRLDTPSRVIHHSMKSSCDE